VSAAKGCTTCIHTASPFFNSSTEEDELIKPAVEGTRAVMRACHAAGIHRVVLTSSTASVFAKKTEEGHVFTEEDWSDEQLLRQNRVLYPLSKTLAERAAWDFVEEHKDMQLIVVRGGAGAGEEGGLMGRERTVAFVDAAFAFLGRFQVVTPSCLHKMRTRVYSHLTPFHIL
jgi:nucleoside-diphosphate-sugar epimerase